MTSEQIRHVLQPFTRDGSEATEAIVRLVQSTNRPPDLRRAVAKILQQRYGNHVHIDTVMALFADQEMSA